MRSGFRKHTIILQLALLLASLVVISGCWIPLPEETAIVVEVFDAQGNPVDGVTFLLDGTEHITGSQTVAGQVFVNLNEGKNYTLQLDTNSLVDPQGGIGWVPLAYKMSGDTSALAFTNKPFVGSSEVLIVPVDKGEFWRVIFYLDDILKSPMDNQWLTDGLDTANDYRTADTDEFTNSPNPTFWWRQDPSLGETVNFTFQLWRDDDGDTRYPLGVMNEADYNAFSKTPDWEEANQAMFSTVVYSSGGSVWPLGWTYAYAGSPLGTSPASGEGEYVWRVIQENPDSGALIKTKLGAFYTYSGYYYASTESGSLDMSGSGPSANVNHRAIFNVVEGATPAGVMEASFDSVSSNRYQQRTAAQHSSSLAAGSGTTNQLTILYNTDEDGQAVVSQEAGGGHLGIIRVLATNKQRILLTPVPTPKPHLQGKEFQMSYFTDTDQFDTFPIPLFGGNIFYLGTLDDPDYQDPLW